VPLVPPKVGTVQLPAEGSAGKRAQNCVGDNVKVVTAFQNVAAHLLQQDVKIECDVLVAGNSKEARDKVIELVQEAGMSGWHAGPIENSAAAEALTSILIQITGVTYFAFRHQDRRPGRPRTTMRRHRYGRRPTDGKGRRRSSGLILAAPPRNSWNWRRATSGRRAAIVKAGRVVALASITPSAEAIALARATEGPASSN
jgi:hypothetical protein